MATTDKRIDAYIKKREPFARPILTHLRELVHDACPDCEETIKWGMPSFTYSGEILCNIAGFKNHVAVSFWKRALLKDPKGLLKEGAMGSLGRIMSMDDLPSDAATRGFVKQAMKLTEAGIKVPKPKPGTRPELLVPEALHRALAKNRAARTAFEKFPPSHRRDYVEWVTEAKTDATRDRRIEQAIEWIAEGKPRHWKYQKK